MKLLLEHNTTPGTVYSEEHLLFGDCGMFLENVQLNEASKTSDGLVKFRGKFQEADAINKNKRTYPYAILEQNVKAINESLKNGGLCGELDHPSDSIIHFSNVSHKVTKLWWEGKVLMGEGAILNTPSGKILKSLINDGIRIGISSRGVGNGKVNENGILVIGEGYKLITFDAVADPSTYSAFQEKIVSNENVVELNKNNPENSTKNENRSIHINKDLLLYFVGGVFKERLNCK